MDIQKQIPAALFIRNSKARIYYEGFKNRCFHCKADDHLKVNCPQLQKEETGNNVGGRSQATTSTEQGPLLYASVASGASCILAQRLEQARKVTTNEDESEEKTTVAVDDTIEPTGGEEEARTGELGTASVGATQRADMEIDEANDDETNNGTKRALAASRSTSDESTDEQEKGKEKSLPKRQKSNSTGHGDHESVLEGIQNLPKDKGMNKNDGDGKGWSTVAHKSGSGRRGGKR